MTSLRLLGAVAACLHLCAAHAADAGLAATLAQRFQNDRTGACVLAATIDGEHVERGAYCAAPRPSGAPGADACFEIGSVSKTMTAFLVAGLIDQGKWSLDDPIAMHLPPGTQVPRQGERQILVRDLVTHSSGLPALPPDFRPRDPHDPYAGLTAADLLASLSKVRLTRPIGSQVEYSNFGMMVLSLAVARAEGGDLEAALDQQLFDPLRMTSAYIAHARPGPACAGGHLPSGQPAAPWTIEPDLGGVGMVHASLNDLIRYAQAELDPGASPLARRLRMTQQPIGHGFAMNWMRTSIGAHDLLVHEGGTGGFSSLVALEPARHKAVVILSDTALTDLGGLGDVGLSLLGVDVPVGQPRIAASAPPSLRQALVAAWELPGVILKIWQDGDRLMAQGRGKPIELRFDSHGDFYADAASLLITPISINGKVERIALRQGGGVLEGTRAGSHASALTATNPAWKDWAGEYRLLPQFTLKVFEEGGQLKVQGTGQPSIAAEASGPDAIEVKQVGARVQFHRDAAGKVDGLSLQQHGQTLQGQRLP